MTAKDWLAQRVDQINMYCPAYFEDDGLCFYDGKPCPFRESQGVREIEGCDIFDKYKTEHADEVRRVHEGRLERGR